MLKFLHFTAKLSVLCLMLIGVVLSLNGTALLPMCQLSVYCEDCIQLSGRVPGHLCQLSVYCEDCIQLSGRVPGHLCQLSVYCMDCIQLSGRVPVHLVSCLYTVWTV